jgi:hypothetical protein
MFTEYGEEAFGVRRNEGNFNTPGQRICDSPVRTVKIDYTKSPKKS